MSPSIPVFSERPKAAPTPKLRALVKFPGTVAATTGIEVTKENGVWTFETDWSDFATVSSTPTSSTNYVLNYDAISHIYTLVPTVLLGGGGGFLDVPIDGVQYGRQSVAGVPAWTPIDTVTAGVASFNTRTGAVTLTSGDVTTVLPASSTTPVMDGAAAVGVGTTWARSDHIHPSDTSRAAVSHTHTASAITDFAEAVDDRVGSLLVAGTNVTLSYNDVANTLTINSSGGGGTPSIINPIVDGVATPGVATAYTREDHVHPTDTSRVAKAGDTMTGALKVAGALWLNTGSTFGISTDNSELFVHAGGNGGVWFQNGTTGTIGNFDNTGNFAIFGANAYKPGGGSWTAPSDARIKNIIGDYKSGLDEILRLSPKIYTYKGNDTPAPPDGKSAVPYADSRHYGVAASETEFVGLIAQDAEKPMPEMVSLRAGYIDGVAVDDLRELDTTPLVFALINACKELAARVEELEGTKMAAPKMAAAKAAPKRKKK